MKTLKTPLTARTAVAELAKPVVLVPTMGALHTGHAELLGHARRLAGAHGTVVVSIFVNPTQFGPGEDFPRYPRTLSADLALCRSAKVDAVFVPTAAAMYPGGRSSTYVDEGAISLPLCGRSRPGHFRGVCTVVTKLFNITRPDIAVFGEKDWQQLAVIRRMVADLDIPVRIAGFPTVREQDGLALSSRNRMLSKGERAAAPGIHRALIKAAATPTTPTAIAKNAASAIRSIPGAIIDYVEAVDAETLLPARNRRRAARLAAAVFFGKTRLIDNVAIPTHRGKQ